MKTDHLAYIQQRARQPITVDWDALTAEEVRDADDEVSTVAKVLSGIGAVFATLLFLIFLVWSGVIESEEAALVTGLGLVFAALWLGRQPRTAFLATTIICAYLVGVSLVFYSMADRLTERQLVLPVIAVAVLTLATSRNYFLIFVATVSLPTCLLFLHFTEAGSLFLALAVLLPALAFLLVNLLEHYLLGDRRLQPLRAGLAVSLLLGMAWYRWASYFGVAVSDYSEAVVAGGLYVCCLVTVWYSLSARWTVAAGLILAPLLLLPLLLGSVFLLLLSHRNNYFIGTGLGTLGLVYFTGQYYYDLRWDLLDKSLALMASGALLLLLYFIVQRRFPAHVPH